MSEMIKCPECGSSIDISKALSKNIEANLETELRKRLDDQKKRLQKENDAEVNRLLGELQTAHENELNLRKQANFLAERERSLDLEVARKMDEERVKVAEKTAKEIQESHRLKDAEKDRKISDALSQVEDLKRRIEQGSQQSQGEILEVEIEEIIRAEFPFDAIEPVAKGVKGGDIVQTVRSKDGEEAGKILWEMKRTKSFSEGWISKLKADARLVKASICILATETMPSGMESFGMVEGVWVTPLKDCVPLSRSLRFGLTQVARERLMQSGKKEKAEVMYDYLIGVEFKGRIEALVEAYKTMKEDLESERRSMEKIWAKREKQINQITFNLAGMHGEMEALAGDSLPNVKLLEMGQ